MSRNHYGFLLTSTGENTSFFTARSVGESQWKLSRLETFSGNPGAYFVNTLDAGKYVDMYAADNAPDEWRPEPGRLRRYTSRRPGFCTGSIDASEVAYFYTGTRWVHLWLSD